MLILVVRRNGSDMHDYMNELRELLARTEMCHDKTFTYYHKDEIYVEDVKILFKTAACGINHFLGLKPDYYHINGLSFASVLSGELYERGAKRLTTIGDIVNIIVKHLKEKEKKPMTKPVTNFEFYKDEIKELATKKNHCGIAIVNEKPVKCGLVRCADCKLDDPTDHSCRRDILFNWLYEEHKEMPTISAAERKFLELLRPDYYIARNGDNLLYVMVDRPVKAISTLKWEPAWSCSYNIHPGYLDGVNFNFIKWEDEEPWKVEDLLKLEVK